MIAENQEIIETKIETPSNSLEILRNSAGSVQQMTAQWLQNSKPFKDEYNHNQKLNHRRIRTQFKSSNKISADKIAIHKTNSKEIQKSTNVDFNDLKEKIKQFNERIEVLQVHKKENPENESYPDSELDSESSDLESISNDYQKNDISLFEEEQQTKLHGTLHLW